MMPSAINLMIMTHAGSSLCMPNCFTQTSSFFCCCDYCHQSRSAAPFWSETLEILAISRSEQLEAIFKFLELEGCNAIHDLPGKGSCS